VPAVEHYMHRALELARKAEGRTRPNPAVGAVLVRGGEIVGEGYHPEAGQPHAEIFALRSAGEKARGADLYVTLEPCCHQGRTGPCVDALLAAGISRAFIGVPDPNPLVSGRGMSRLQAGGVAIRAGVLEKECRRLIAPFAKHISTGLPYVILKTAMTLDGKTATANGHSQWISNAGSREHVHSVRDRVDAIMIGIGTVLRDDPRLTTRLASGGRDAVRIVVDAGLRIPEDAAVLTVESAAPTWIAVAGDASPEKAARLQRRGVDILRIDGPGERVAVESLLKELGKRGIQSVLLEGGGELNASALHAGMVDRLMVYVAPKLVGGDGLGMFSGKGVEQMTDAVALTEISTTMFGDDVLIEGEVQRCSPA
jgi:diaminohydroxyphosphoribosylaminopyrimidine deaminase / 5-amino-6-(5-phosphoribosylamino)uracil reductase